MAVDAISIWVGSSGQMRVLCPIDVQRGEIARGNARIRSLCYLLRKFEFRLDSGWPWVRHLRTSIRSPISLLPDIRSGIFVSVYVVPRVVDMASG